MALKIEKVTVSIPKEDLKTMTEYESRLRLPRSALFRQAIKLWLKVMEKEEMRKKYAKVYSKEHVKEKQIKQVEEMLHLTLETWHE